MRGLRVEALLPNFEGVEWTDMPMPEPQAGEVRVKVMASSINFPDLLMSRGEYQLKPPLPFALGLEFAGVIDKLGEGVSGLKVGDEVVGGNGFGGMAEYAVASPVKMRPKPRGMSWEQAASYPAAYIAAYVAFVRCAHLQPREWVLVHGAAGGVGLAAVDVAKAMGARVIATASTEKKRQAIRDIHAPDAVISPDAGFYEEVRRITGGRGADVIFDPVGGDVFDESTRCIAFGGRLLVVGFASGRIATVATNMPLIKGFSVVGVRAGEYGRRFPEKGQENFTVMDQWAESGMIRPHIDRVLPMARWREGFDLLANREVIGKVVLVP
jgi:NADPH2:quinone reductase